MKPKIVVHNTALGFWIEITINGNLFKSSYNGGMLNCDGKKYFVATPYHGEFKVALYEMVPVPFDLKEITVATKSPQKKDLTVV